MNQTQENITAMLDTVNAYLEANRSRWSSFKALADAVTDLRTGIASIDALAGRQHAVLKGYTEDKAQVRAELEEALSLVCEAAAAYAATRTEPHLRNKVDMTRSRLGRLTADLLEERAREVAVAVRGHLAELGDYRVTEQTIAELEALIARFGALKQATRTSVAGRIGATATLAELITETRTLLRERIDRLVTLLAANEPEFVAGYRGARVVVNRAATRSGDGDPAPNTASTAPQGELSVAKV